MLFNTWIFVLFFMVIYPVYVALRGTPFMVAWLLLASYVFYAWLNPLYLPLIGYATAVTYITAWLMEKAGRRKLWLILSLVNSLGLLGFFKYAGFVTDNLNALLGQLGASYRLPAPGILLPIGISFFTFRTVSYTMDYYGGRIPRERGLIRFAAYVAFFPQLLMGPIERSTNLLPQLSGRPSITRQDIADGLSLFIVGLFKKAALADYLALYVDKVFDAPAQFKAPALMLASFAYAWQIYFDFSGYTDMARGIGQMMGFRLMLNFNNPYLATDLGDFWRRWHISLSTWFRDYVYIPLGGNRAGKFNTYRNMVLTMVISGLWHGAAWTFVIWGALHAAGRVVTRELERAAFYKEKVPKLAKQMGVFSFVTFAWIFFRAPTFHNASLIVTRIFTTGWADPAFPVLALVLALAVWLYEHLYESHYKWMLALAPARVGIVVMMALYLTIFAGTGAQPFIYFQF